MMNPFEVFGLNPRYHVDKVQLRRDFLLQSRALHPDVYAQASAPEQAAALQRSSELNQAYKLLLDDEARLQWLLTDAGLLQGEERQPQLPPDFLMEMLDRNEQLQDLQTSGDAEGLAAVVALTQQEANALLQQAERHLQHHDAAPDADTRGIALQAVLPLYLQRRYLLRLLAQSRGESEL